MFEGWFNMFYVGESNMKITNNKETDFSHG